MSALFLFLAPSVRLDWQSFNAGHMRDVDFLTPRQVEPVEQGGGVRRARQEFRMLDTKGTPIAQVDRERTKRALVVKCDQIVRLHGRQDTELKWHGQDS